MTGSAGRHDKRHRLASRHGHAQFSHVAEPPQGRWSRSAKATCVLRVGGAEVTLASDTFLTRRLSEDIDSRKINGRNKNRLFSSPRARRANGEQPADNSREDVARHRSSHGGPVL